MMSQADRVDGERGLQVILNPRSGVGYGSGSVNRLASTHIPNRKISSSMRTNPPYLPRWRAFDVGGPVLIWRSVVFQKSMTQILRREGAPGAFAILTSVRRRGGRRPPTMGDSQESRLPEDFASVYDENCRLLSYMAAKRFRVPAPDVPDVLQDVFLAYIRNRGRIRADARTWLIGALALQCRVYWRRNGRNALCAAEELADIAVDVDDYSRRLDVAEVLRRLPKKCRELLSLRFVEHRSSLEIASHLDTTVDYARKLVHRCVLNARELVQRSRRGRP